jgi:hypothetical protein
MGIIVHGKWIRQRKTFAGWTKREIDKVVLWKFHF